LNEGIPVEFSVWFVNTNYLLSTASTTFLGLTFSISDTYSNGNSPKVIL